VREYTWPKDFYSSRTSGFASPALLILLAAVSLAVVAVLLNWQAILVFLVKFWAYLAAGQAGLEPGVQAGWELVGLVAAGLGGVLGFTLCGAMVGGAVSSLLPNNGSEKAQLSGGTPQKAGPSAVESADSQHPLAQRKDWKDRLHSIIVSARRAVKISNAGLVRDCQEKLQEMESFCADFGQDKDFAALWVRAKEAVAGASIRLQQAQEQAKKRQADLSACVTIGKRLDKLREEVQLCLVSQELPGPDYLDSINAEIAAVQDEQSKAQPLANLAELRQVITKKASWFSFLARVQVEIDQICKVCLFSAPYGEIFVQVIQGRGKPLDLIHSLSMTQKIKTLLTEAGLSEKEVMVRLPRCLNAHRDVPASDASLVEVSLAEAFVRIAEEIEKRLKKITWLSQQWQEIAHQLAAPELNLSHLNRLRGTFNGLRPLAEELIQLLRRAKCDTLSPQLRDLEEKFSSRRLELETQAAELSANAGSATDAGGGEVLGMANDADLLEDQILSLLQDFQNLM
jgi:hypothetical protein